jgi:hypothetical protein
LDKQYIEVNNLRNWWHFVRPGLEDILKKSPEYWIPEDVYTDLFNGRSQLWVFSENNYPVGFAILENKQTELHCWCGWANSNGHFKNAVECVSEIAKASGHKYLTFESRRTGWDRLAPQFGFKPRKWIKEIL